MTWSIEKTVEAITKVTFTNRSPSSRSPRPKDDLMQDQDLINIVSTGGSTVSSKSAKKVHPGDKKVTFFYCDDDKNSAVKKVKSAKARQRYDSASGTRGSISIDKKGGFKIHHFIEERRGSVRPLEDRRGSVRAPDGRRGSTMPGTEDRRGFSRTPSAGRVKSSYEFSPNQSRADSMTFIGVRRDGSGVKAGSREGRLPKVTIQKPSHATLDRLKDLDRPERRGSLRPGRDVERRGSVRPSSGNDEESKKTAWGSKGRSKSLWDTAIRKSIKANARYVIIQSSFVLI